MLFFINETNPTKGNLISQGFYVSVDENLPGNIIDNLNSITEQDKERLFYGTALEWLDLDKKSFI